MPQNSSQEVSQSVSPAASSSCQMEPQQQCFYSQLFSLPGLDNKQQEDEVQLSVYLAHTGDCRLGTGWPA